MYMSANVLGEADKADRFPVHATTHAILDFLNISTDTPPLSSD